jgi:PTH1 family peptidyl-tRNA hydrolase
MSILLIAGLGNPGREYAATRHNLGWTAIEALAKKHGLAWRQEPSFEAEVARWEIAPGRSCWLAKPLTFMNESGRSIASLARFYKLSPPEIAAVHDDLSFELGREKVSVGGSAAGHNGIASLIEHLGGDFARYRLGVGPKVPPEMDMKDFVLGKFSAEQLAIITQKLDHYAAGLELLILSGPDTAMNRINRKEAP